MLDLCPAPRRAFFVFHSWGGVPNPPYFFSLQKKTLRAAPCRPHLAGRLQKASPPSCRPQDKFIFIRAFYNLSFLGRRPKPALLFLIAEKEGKKASPLGTYKTYFEPGVLQLPTVGQVKCLYNSVKNKFYRRLQRGALNGNNKQQQQKQGGKRHFVLCRAEQYKSKCL